MKRKIWNYLSIFYLKKEINKLKILHIASFTGNIGDEANHQGFRNNFKKYIKEDFTIKELEMRKFYKSWNELKFDEEFVELCNEYDLVVIGGGNFLEISWDYSKTGTTIDIDIDLLDKIKSPIFFNAVGVDDGKGLTELNLNKFKKFLNYILESDNILFSIRNDGSRKILGRYFEEKELKNVYVVPDGGFFIEPKEYYHPEINTNIGDKYIGINIAGDMRDIRFKDYNKFKKEFGKLINRILEENKNIKIVFLPHIYKDYEIISDVFQYIEDNFRRAKISVAPLLNGELDGGNYIFDLYNKLDLILGMRFHSNICAIGQNIPNIGLITYHKHGYLFDEIGLEDRKLQVDESNFYEDLYIKIIKSLSELKDIEDRYKLVNIKLLSDIENFYTILKEFLEIENKN